jgi:hypothetical protein
MVVLVGVVGGLRSSDSSVGTIRRSAYCARRRSKRDADAYRMSCESFADPDTHVDGDS